MFLFFHFPKNNVSGRAMGSETHYGYDLTCNGVKEATLVKYLFRQELRFYGRAPLLSTSYLLHAVFIGYRTQQMWMET